MIFLKINVALKLSPYLTHWNFQKCKHQLQTNQLKTSLQKVCEQIKIYHQIIAINLHVPLLYCLLFILTVKSSGFFFFSKSSGRDFQ